MAGASTSSYKFDNVAFIKVYGCHSLTSVVKLVSASQCRKMMNMINML